MSKRVIAVSFPETNRAKARLARVPRRTHTGSALFGLALLLFASSASAGGVFGGIINGETSAPGARPWQVSLQSSGTHFCGGSIIGASWILTAAHCVDRRSAGAIEVLAATNDLTVAGERKSVQSIAAYMDYNPETVDQDIALLQLASPLDCLNTGVCSKIGVITPATGTLATPGTAALVSGWGDIDPTTATHYPDSLQEVLVSILNTGDCNAPGSYNGALTANMLCAGYMNGGKDSCQGDSGGPLVVQNSDGVSYLLAGLVSWGYDCAAANYPGIYTRVENYTDWLVAQTGLSEAELTSAARSTVSSNSIALLDSRSPGCALGGSGDRADPLLPVLALLSALYLVRRRAA